MITDFGIFKVISEVGSRLVPPRSHIDTAIDYRSSIACAVCFTVAVDAKLIAVCANVVSLQGHLEAVNFTILCPLIEVNKEAWLGPVLDVRGEVAVSPLLLPDGSRLVTPEAAFAPEATGTPEAARGID